MEKWKNGKRGLRDLARPEKLRSVRLAIGLPALAILAAACASAEPREPLVVRLLPTGLAPQDMVTVILDKFSGEYSRSKEEEVARCVGKSVGAVQPTVRLVPSEEFRRVAWPSGTLSEQPATVRQWVELATDAAFRAQIAPLGLRYLIIVQGSTEQSWTGWGGGAGYGGVAGVTGYRVSIYLATLVDVKRGAEVGLVRVGASGSNEVVIFPPLGFRVIRTEAQACDELGEQVAKFLVEETPPGETAGEQPGGGSAKPPAQENRPQ